MDGRDATKIVDGVFAAFDTAGKFVVAAVTVVACSAGFLAILGLVWLGRHLVIAWN